jgi:hypothetical protein
VSDDDVDLANLPVNLGGVESAPQDPAATTEPGPTPQPESDPEYEEWARREDAKEAAAAEKADEEGA